MIQNANFWDTFRVVQELKANKVFLIEGENSDRYVKKIYQNSQRMIQALHRIKKLNSRYLLKIFLIQEKDHEIHVLHEYCPAGSLDQIISNNGYQNDTKIRECISDILKGLQDLLSIGLMHRDIKPQNIVFDGFNHKIIDFETLKPIDSQDPPIIRSRVGTEIYMAPEVFHFQPYTSKCDIWSLGCVIYYLVHRNHLFLTQGRCLNPNFNVKIPVSNFSPMISLMLKPEDARASLKEVQDFLNRTTQDQDPQYSGQSSTNSTRGENNLQQSYQNPLLKYFCQKFLKWFELLDIVKQLNLINAWISLLIKESQNDGQEAEFLRQVNSHYLFKLTLYKQQRNQILSIKQTDSYDEFISRDQLIKKLKEYYLISNLEEREDYILLILILSQ